MFSIKLNLHPEVEHRNENYWSFVSDKAELVSYLMNIVMTNFQVLGTTTIVQIIFLKTKINLVVLSAAVKRYLLQNPWYDKNAASNTAATPLNFYDSKSFFNWYILLSVAFAIMIKHLLMFYHHCLFHF